MLFTPSTFKVRFTASNLSQRVGTFPVSVTSLPSAETARRRRSDWPDKARLTAATIALSGLWLAVASSAPPIDKVNATTRTADRVINIGISVLSGLHDRTAGVFANRVTLTVS